MMNREGKLDPSIINQPERTPPTPPTPIQEIPMPWTWTSSPPKNAPNSCGQGNVSSVKHRDTWRKIAQRNEAMDIIDKGFKGETETLMQGQQNKNTAPTIATVGATTT